MLYLVWLLLNKMFKKERQKGFGLIGLLLSLAIMTFIVLKFYGSEQTTETDNIENSDIEVPNTSIKGGIQAIDSAESVRDSLNDRYKVQPE